MADRTFSAGSRGSPIILMEFNELCPPLLARWMAEGRLPNFSRLHERSDTFVTDADVTDPGQLEPWIQWYSAHTGLGYDQHRVFHLADGPRAGHDDIFRTLIAAGRRVASFASMNQAPFAAEGSLFVADPWTEQGNASPAELNIYNAFVSHQVREYSNADARLSIADNARFLLFLLRHGLSAATVSHIARQLASERTVDRRLSYRRASVLDAIQYDVFRSYYNRLRPEFASFFINSTAHFQHSYWRHLDPAAFIVRPDSAEMAIYGEAVRYGYEAMDRLVGRFLTLAERHDATLIFMTALSQQPFLRHEELGGQHFHRLGNVDTFLDQLGIDRLSLEPTMTHQYMLRFADASACQRARERLSALAMEEGGRQLFGFAAHDDAHDTSLYFGCQIATRTAPTTIVLDHVTSRRQQFGELLYRIDAIKSGCHHPEGALWFATGAGRSHAEKVSILDLFPTLTDWFGVQARPAGRRGISLLSVLGYTDQQAVA